MKITTVRYRKLVTGSGYNNQAVEAEAEVGKGEKPEDVLLELALWVRGQLGETPVGLDFTQLRFEVEQLYRTRDQLRQAVVRAETEQKTIREQITALEIKREQAGGEPAMPF